MHGDPGSFITRENFSRLYARARLPFMRIKLVGNAFTERRGPTRASPFSLSAVCFNAFQWAKARRARILNTVRFAGQKRARKFIIFPVKCVARALNNCYAGAAHRGEQRALFCVIY